MVKVNLDLVNQGHGYVELELQKASYSNNRLAIQLIWTQTGEPWATLTVNLPDVELDEGEFFVKAWSENKDTARALMEQTDLFVDTFKTVPTGFVEAEVWKFNNPKTLDFMDVYGAPKKDCVHIAKPIKMIQDAIAVDMYGMTIDEAHSKFICINCKKPFEGRCFSQAGFKEYKLSALCEICFDKGREKK